MTLPLSSPEDIINYGLAKIGHPQRIGSVYDGSDASKKALDVYAQTRDQMLRDGDWDFATRNVAMTLLKSAPSYLAPGTPWSSTYPPIPWKYEYQYPDDCLKVRAIKLQPLFPTQANYQPQSINFSITNDNGYTPAKKVILCNVPQPSLLIYTAQVTDPTVWEASFTEALATQIAERLAPSLNPQILENEEKMAQIETAQANEVGDDHPIRPCQPRSGSDRPQRSLCRRH